MNPKLIVPQLPGLRRYARALTRDAWAADDLVQDTLERACAKWQLWTAGPTFGPGCSPSCTTFT